VPELKWRKRNGAILPTGSWKPGKETVLGSDDYIDPPGHFTIYRKPSPVVRRFRERRGKPAMVEVERLEAIQAADGTRRARSEPWTVPTPPGMRISWRLLFDDDQLHRSPVLHISRLGKMTPTIGAGIPIPPVELNAGVGLDIITSVDPLVELTVLTPWADGDLSLDGYIRELAEDAADKGEDPDASIEDFVSYLAPHLPKRAPAGWEFSVLERIREIPEGERVETAVRLRAPTRASTAFAVQMRTLDHPEQLVSATDLLVIEVPEDRAPATFLFGSDRGEDGEDALADDANERELVGT
jgi:hypothetical protein